MCIGRQMFRAFRAYISELVISTNIHGFQHVLNRNLNRSERIAWLFFIFGAIGGAIFSSLSQYRRYYVRPTVMSVDRDHRSWNGTLPAGTLCFDNVVDSSKTLEFLQREFNIDRDHDEYPYFLGFVHALMNATATNYEDLASYGQDERIDNLDLFEVAKEVRRSVYQTVNITSYDANAKVDFQPVVTEKGMCYTFNSPMAAIVSERKNGSQTRGISFKRPLSCQYGKQQCFLKLEIYDSTASIEIHSPFEFPKSGSEVITLEKSDELLASIKVVETVASDALRDLDPQQRKCLFSNEKIEGIPIYSRSLCFMKCRANMAMEMCDCMPHFYPFLDGPSCSPSAYECLLDFKWPIWTPYLCDCPSTCIEHSYAFHHITKRSWSAGSNISLTPKSTFRWDIIPPRVRIRRDVVFSFEDLLVSFGGAASLFIGFSLISILEAGYVTLKHLSYEFLLILKMKKNRKEHV